MKNALLVSAFPGCGKTWLFTHSDRVVLDSDSSTFDKKAFPGNYISHIKSHSAQADVILISTHAEVRDALVENGMAFTLVYPCKDDKQEYLRRYMDRGSDQAFVCLLDSNWDEWISELEKQEQCQHLVLDPGQFLSQALGLT